MRVRPTGRDLLVAVSLANLLGLRLWAAVLDPSTGYFLDRPRTAATYLGTLTVVAAVAAIGLALAGAYRASESSRSRRVIEVIFFLGCALAVQGARPQLEDLFAEGAARRVAANVALGAGGLVLLLALLPGVARQRVRRGAATALLVISPFALVTTGQVLLGTWRAVSGAEAARFAEKAPADMKAASTGPRVVVVVMDELDQFLAFDDRPAGLLLPVFDAFATTSFHGTRARAPAMLTEKALPSLLVGRTVVAAADAGPSDRRLTFDDGSVARFSDVDTLLRSATASGKNVALVGFYHPYCRVIGDDVASCSSRSYWPETQGLAYAAVVRRQAQVLIESFAHGDKVLRLFGINRRATAATQPWHAETWKLIEERANRDAADPRFDLVFVHHSVPHTPGIWDAKGGSLMLDEPGTYEDNLALADKTLGGLLDAIANGPRGAETSVVVLSDHGKRVKAKTWLPSPRLAPGESRPVPFLVRVPGGTGLVYDAPFDATRVHALVPELLAGRLTTSETVRDWVANPALARSRAP